MLLFYIVKLFNVEQTMSIDFYRISKLPLEDIMVKGKAV